MNRATPAPQKHTLGVGVESWGCRLRVLHTVDATVAHRSWDLGAGDVLAVGREVGPAEVEIDDPRLSRWHLTIERQSQVQVIDRGTKNGTRVNRSQLQGTFEVWADALIEIGQNVLHLGYDVAPLGRILDGLDPLIRVWARQISASAPVVGICAAPGVGRRTLCRELHRRSGRTGGLLFLAAEDLNEALKGEGGALRVGGTIALLGAETVAEETLRLWLRTAAAHDTRVLLVGPVLWKRVERWAPPEVRCVLPALSTRRATVWEMTRTWVGECTGRDTVRFSRGALAVWLSQSMQGGWVPLRERLHALLERYADLECLRSRHVRSVLPSQRPRTVANRSSRQMQAPALDELMAALKRFQTMREVAKHFGRTRRQVYRWMEAYGVERPESKEG